jgi:osmotically-inducible protein OsmY
MTDAHLQQTVLDELDWEPSLNAARIVVGVRDGVVTLTGQVSFPAEKWIAEGVASRVSGVTAVAEDLEVRGPGRAEQSDEAIAERALQVLAEDVFVPDDRVAVEVRQGWVTLTGTFDWSYQSRAAEADLRRLPGVAGVTNATLVRPAARAQRDFAAAASGRRAQAQDWLLVS